MTEIRIDNIDQLISLYEAESITTDVCLQCLEKMLKCPVIVFQEPDGTYTGGKERILKNLRLLSEQIKAGGETLIFLNLDHDLE